MSHDLRKQDKVDYITLDSGTTSEGATTQEECSSPPPQAKLFNSSSPPSSEDDYDVEIAQLEARKGLFETEERKEAKRRRRETLRREVDALAARSESRKASQARGPPLVANLPCPPAIAPPHPIAPQHPVTNTDLAARFTAETLNLGDLRGLSSLNAQVEAELYRAGVGDQREDPQEAITSRPGKKQSLNCVSGRDSHIRDSVVCPLIWPHTVLKYQYVSGDVSYQKLDFPLLVAGELKVWGSRATSQQEHLGRRDLLEKVAYYCRDYTWPSILRFHEAALVEVERGERRWDDKDYRDLESSVLYGHRLQQETQRSNIVRTYAPRPDSNYTRQERRFYCLAYNRGECAHAGSHDGIIGRVKQEVEHFCSNCFRNDRLFKLHPETKCPSKRNIKQ